MDDQTRPYTPPSPTGEPPRSQQPPAPGEQLWPCPRCQTPIPATSVFCPRCGVQLTSTPAAAQSPGMSTAKKVAAGAGAVVLLLFVIGVLASAFGGPRPGVTGVGASPTATALALLPTFAATLEPTPPPTASALPTDPPTPEPTIVPTPTTAPTSAPTPGPTTEPTPTASPTAPPTAPPTPVVVEPEEPEEDFDDGLWEIGTDIAPGTYRTLWDPDSCYWARLSGYSGEIDDIISNNFGSGWQLVTIGRRDVAFESSNCGYWTSDLSRVTDSDTEFGEGTFIVGVDIQPGTYRSSEGDGCYWARLSGFGGTIREVIANDFRSSGRARVQIRARDTGFTSSNCGTWSRD